MRNFLSLLERTADRINMLINTLCVLRWIQSHGVAMTINEGSICSVYASTLRIVCAGERTKSATNILCKECHAVALDIRSSAHN